MYLYGFDIGGTKCAVILAKVEGDQVDFLERYEMKRFLMNYLKTL